MRYEAAATVKQKQESWLLECCKRNAGSKYGISYGFGRITSIEEYQKRVPLVTYEDISGFIEQIAEGADSLLFSGEPVAFEVTGGSTGGGKLIPYTQESFADFERAILPWFIQTMEYYEIGKGRSYWSITPAMRTTDTTPRGIAIGVSDAAYLGEKMGDVLSSNLAVPLWAAELNDLHHWQVATLYWLIRSVELEFISVWSPTFLLMLLDALQQHSETVQELLTHGGMIEGYKLYADPEALKRLNRYLEKSDAALLWPDLKLVSCWEDAMSKPYAKRLKSLFPQVNFQPKGLISTESVVTIPDAEGTPLLSAESGFYEFIDAKEEVHLADNLHLKEEYEVVITTSGGLYRYRSGDKVRYEGDKNGLPILRFTGRKGRMSDMVGEKLNEAFVQQVLAEVDGFAMLVAQPYETPSYLLAGESGKIRDFVDHVDRELMKNHQYAYARRMGQLGKPEYTVLDNLIARYIDYKLESGGRIGDIKIPVLVTDRKWLDKIKRVTA